MTVYMFPGQGSQYKGMGGSLFDEFSDYTAIADEVLGYSVKELCHQDPRRVLGQTQYTQPALYVVNALNFLRQQELRSTPPRYLLGHSLGEYNALFAAGVFDFETGLRLVKKRGLLMSQAPEGGMAAILGEQLDSIGQILEKSGLNGIDIANHNSGSQVVVAGPKEDLLKAEKIFKTAGLRFVILNVSAAFHSRYMQSAMAEFREFASAIHLASPTIPVIANVNARPYQASRMGETLIEQIIKPVQWLESIRYLIGKGAQQFEEIGPGQVLTKLTIAIRSTSAALATFAPMEPASAAEHPLPVHSNRSAVDGDPANTYDRAAAPVMSSHGPAVESASEEDPNAAPGIEAPARQRTLTGERLGATAFRDAYKVKYAYIAGSMHRGISSKELVVRLGKAGLLGIYGSAGVQLAEVERSIQYIQTRLVSGEAYGVSLQSNENDTDQEMEAVNLYLRYGVPCVEAARYKNISPALVKYKLHGLARDAEGKILIKNRVIAKISHPEIAELFLAPPPDGLLRRLVRENQVTQEQVEMARQITLADDLCVESDAGGYTDRGGATTLLPTVIRLRDQLARQNPLVRNVRVGAAGGIGCPEAALAMFVLGADFILTGSINQCTVEAGMSDEVKDMLQSANVCDTEHIPTIDAFELGSTVQVLKRGILFPMRAKKLLDLWKMHKSLDDIDEFTKMQLQEKVFKRRFDDIYKEVIESEGIGVPHVLTRGERDPKHKMTLVWRWYFARSIELAINGVRHETANYQIYCGPALGAFNQWVRETALESWKNRHVDIVATKLMDDTAMLLTRRLRDFHDGSTVLRW